MRFFSTAGSEECVLGEPVLDVVFESGYDRGEVDGALEDPAVDGEEEVLERSDGRRLEWTLGEEQGEGECDGVECDRECNEESRYDTDDAMGLEGEDDEACKEEEQGKVEDEREGPDDGGDAPVLDAEVTEVAETGLGVDIVWMGGHPALVFLDPLAGEHGEEGGGERADEAGEPQTVDPYRCRRRRRRRGGGGRWDGFVAEELEEERVRVLGWAGLCEGKGLGEKRGEDGGEKGGVDEQNVDALLPALGEVPVCTLGDGNVHIPGVGALLDVGGQSGTHFGT